MAERCHELGKAHGADARERLRLAMFVMIAPHGEGFRGGELQLEHLSPKTLVVMFRLSQKLKSSSIIKDGAYVPNLFYILDSLSWSGINDSQSG